MPFMADCTVLLSQRVADRVAARAIRVLKYRGSPHVLNEVPFVIGPAGVEIGSSNGVHPEPQPFNEQVSTGVERLDAMLCGGIYRGTNALITGSSGGGKSTLAGAFIEAACRRNERALFISFDENSRDIVRDLAHDEHRSRAASGQRPTADGGVAHGGRLLGGAFHAHQAHDHASNTPAVSPSIRFRRLPASAAAWLRAPSPSG